MAQVSIVDAFQNIKHVNDCVAEIDAMIPRLYRVREQLSKQTDYIDLTVKEAITTTDGGDPGLVANVKVASLNKTKKFRHNGGTGKKKLGGTDKDIFNQTREVGQEVENTEGMDIVDTKKFFIAVNSILTQTNDITSTNCISHSKICFQV